MSEADREVGRLRERVALLEAKLDAMAQHDPRLGELGGDAASEDAEGRIGRRALLVGAVGAAGVLMNARPAAATQGDALTAGGGVVTCTSITGVQTTGQIGLYGETSSVSGGSGVSGRATSTTGNVTGVIGHSDASGGTGVYGYAAAFSGANRGVSGTSNSESGTGVYGLAWHPTGTGAGVRGHANSPDGWAVVSDGRMKVTGRSFLRTPNKKPNDADLDEGSVSFYLDRRRNKLKVRVRYPDGRLRTGSITLA